MTISGSAMTHFNYEEDYSDPTFTVTASLQGYRPTEGTVFTQMYATTRFDQEPNYYPHYTVLNMSILAEATGANYDSESAGGTVTIGNYIAIATQYYSLNDGITYLYGYHTAIVSGSSISFNLYTFLNSSLDPGTYKATVTTRVMKVFLNSFIL